MADDQKPLPFARFVTRTPTCAALEITPALRESIARAGHFAASTANDGDFLVKFAHNDGPVVQSRGEFLEKFAPSGDTPEEIIQRVGDLELALERKAFGDAGERLTLEQLGALEDRITAIEEHQRKAAAELSPDATGAQA